MLSRPKYKNFNVSFGDMQSLAEFLMISMAQGKLPCKSVDRFLYDIGLLQERINLLIFAQLI